MLRIKKNEVISDRIIYNWIADLTILVPTDNFQIEPKYSNLHYLDGILLVKLGFSNIQ